MRPQQRKDPAQIMQFDNDLVEFRANKHLYKFIIPRQENDSWMIERKTAKVRLCGFKTLADAVTRRNELFPECKVK